MPSIPHPPSFYSRYAIRQFYTSAPRGSVIYGLSVGERGPGRPWSWAQHARRVSFRRLIMRHSLFNVGGERRLTSLTTSKMPVDEQCAPSSSPARETDSPIVNRKQSPPFHSIYPSQSLCLYTTSALDPHTYTSGRWLNQDKLERESRYIQFDFPALCDTAVELCPGAGRMIRYEKKEGGVNRSFVMIMDNGTKVVARLPTRVAGAENKWL